MKLDKMNKDIVKTLVITMLCYVSITANQVAADPKQHNKESKQLPPELEGNLNTSDPENDKKRHDILNQVKIKLPPPQSGDPVLGECKGSQCPSERAKK